MKRKKFLASFGPFIFVAALISVACVLMSCGNKQAGENPAPAVAAPRVDSSATGEITGTVTFAGPPPVLKPIDMSAEQQCLALNSKPVYYPRIVLGPKGKLANVVIYVKAGLAKYSYDTPRDLVQLHQRRCMYDPRVLALMVNQPYQVRNEDPVVHNVHVAPRKNRQWNQSEDVGSPAIEESFQQPEMALPILCSIHPWMRSIAFVFDNPYFAVTSAKGTFTLKNLPPGNYTIEAWQEKLGVLDQAVVIAPKQSKAISFKFKSIS